VHIGEHLQTKGRPSKTSCDSEDTTKGGTDRVSGTSCVLRSFLTLEEHDVICVFGISEQMEKDLESAKKDFEEAKAGVAKLRKELSKLNDQVATSEVCLFSPFFLQSN
jgi:hypothetical protein